MTVSVAAGVTSSALLVLNLALGPQNETRGALGAVAGALGVAVGFLSMRAEEDRGMQTLAAANIGIGLVGIAVGLDVAFADRRAPAASPQAPRPVTGQAKRHERGVALQPLLSGDSVGLAMVGSF